MDQKWVQCEKNLLCHWNGSKGTQGPKMCSDSNKIKFYKGCVMVSTYTDRRDFRIFHASRIF